MGSVCHNSPDKMAKLTACCTVFLTMGLISASSSLPTCPVLTALPPGISCSPSDSCEGVTCFIDTSVTGNSSITVQRCGDPALVDMHAQGVYNDVSFDFMYQFNGSATVTQEGTTVTASLERNQTALVFSAQYLQSQELLWLIPEVTVAINSTECLCNSLEELAVKIDSPLEHNCITNENCTGVTCELDVFGSTYYIALLVLSCEDPPAIDVLVKDGEENPFYEAVFNQSGSSELVLDGIPATINTTIVQSQYSFEVEASLIDVPLFGRVPIIPRHTILLDSTTCPQPPTVTTTASPPPPSPITPPPYNSSNLCNALYNIARMTSPPFACYLSEACTALECELDFTDIQYDVIIGFFPQEAQTKAYVLLSTAEGVIGHQTVQESGTWQYDVAPENSKLIFTFDVMEKQVQFKVTIAAAGAEPTTLIDSMVPLQESSSESQSDRTKALGLSIPLGALALCVGALAVAIVIMVVWRWKRTPKLFTFTPSNYRDLQEREAQVESENAPKTRDHVPQAVENAYIPTLQTSAYQTDV